MSQFAYLVVVFTCLFRLSPSEKNRIIPIQQTRFYEDVGGMLAFDQFLADSDSLLSFDAGFVPADYNPSSAYWVELDFCISDQNKVYLLEFYDQTIDSIKVFVRHESEKEFTFFEFGDKYNFGDREFSHKNFQVLLNRAGEYQAYYRVVNQQYADMRVVIQTVDQFVNYALSEYYLYGIFYGMILIISLYNLLIYSAIRESKYLYYTFYILSVGLFAMSVDGIAYQILWPNMPSWNQISHGFALFLIIFWSIVFSRKFLNLRNRAPRIDRLLILILYLRSAFFLYALIFNHSAFHWRNIELIPLSLIFYGSIQVLRRGYKPARFFVVAYGFLFLGFFVKALLMYSVLPYELTGYSQFTQIISYYSLHICFLFEMLFLSAALSDRVRILKRNKDRVFRRIVAQHDENLRYKDRLNAQLEQKISDRTKELAEKNQLLNESNDNLRLQKKEISEINNMLDLDNYKLRNNLISAQTDRLLQKSISFDDFIQIFPDQQGALKFMADHKWRDNYSCKRCANSKFIEGSSPFSRRCSKCGYNETPTTDTVFHSLKFPLPKAMYILYLYIHGDRRSLNELAEEMDLRKNTIWAFRKKINEYIDLYGSEDLDIFSDLQEIALSR